MSDFNEAWLNPGAVVEVTVQNFGACLREVVRLREIERSMPHAVIDLVRGEDGVYAPQT